MRYLVEHERTGLLSEPGDPSALAQNVIRVLRNSSLAHRLATNAFEESRHYRWAAVRQQWLSVYQEVVVPDRMPVEGCSAATVGISAAPYSASASPKSGI
jgi:hypothetical protein